MKRTSDFAWLRFVFLHRLNKFKGNLRHVRYLLHLLMVKYCCLTFFVEFNALLRPSMKSISPSSSSSPSVAKHAEGIFIFSFSARNSVISCYMWGQYLFDWTLSHCYCFSLALWCNIAFVTFQHETNACDLQFVSWPVSQCGVLVYCFWSRPKKTVKDANRVFVSVFLAAAVVQIEIYSRCYP